MDPVTLLILIGGGLLFASSRKRTSTTSGRKIPPPPATPYTPGELVSVEISQDENGFERFSEGSAGVGIEWAGVRAYVFSAQLPVDIRFYVKGSSKLETVNVPHGKVLDTGSQDALVRVTEFSAGLNDAGVRVQVEGTWLYFHVFEDK